MKKVLLLGLIALSLGACKKTIVKNTYVSEEISDEQLKVTHITSENWDSLKSNFIFQDWEPNVVLFDSKQRSFHTIEPIQVSFIGNNIHIRAYSPRFIKNAKIYVSFLYYDEPFLIAELDEIPAFADVDIPIDFSASRYYQTKSGKKIWVDGFKPVDARFILESDDDYFKTLKKITTDFYVTIGKYDTNNINWGVMKPVHAREAVAIALNLAYMFSTKDFKDSVMVNWKGYFYDDSRNVIPTQTIYDKSTVNRGLVFGLISGKTKVIGLGGDRVYGLDEIRYLAHYADDWADQNTVFHEFGHCMGYAHEGNMTYEGPWGVKKSWWWNCSQMYTRMSINKELPVYSRKFLNSRQNSSRNNYKKDRDTPSTHVISAVGRSVRAAAIQRQRALEAYLGEGFID